LKRILLFCAWSVVVSACGALKKDSGPSYNHRMLKIQEAKIKAGEDPWVKPVQNPTADPKHASLWAKSVGSPYIIRNQKAQAVGDLLTILIEESPTASTKAKTDAKRDGKVDITGTISLGQATADQAGTLTGATQHKNEFKGEGITDRSATLSATVQAVVENVLPNGTLFIRGKKTITINNEDQDVVISGFVRPDDIRINNTVPSSLLADAEIRYVGNGVLSDKQRPGWGARILDWIWPF